MVVGFLMGIMLCAVIGCTFYTGYDYGKCYMRDKIEKEDKEEVKEDNEELKKKKLQEEEARRRNQGLNNIMDYDIDVAMGRREQVE